MKNATRHAAALASMVCGTLAVFALVYTMNGEKPPAKVESELDAISFEVPKNKPKRKKPKPRRRRQAQTVSRAQRAPLPKLSSALSSASFTIPGMGAAGLGSVSKSLLGTANKNLAMTEGALDKAPKAIRRIGAAFPPSARKRGIEGFVKMSVFVNNNGSVERARVLDASPQGVFDEVALQAIRGWEFQPGIYEGESVSAWVTQTFRFELKKTT